MKNPTDKQIESLLGGILGDGFNRCIGALIKAGAVDASKFHKHYQGAGSRCYDLVTEQIAYTAKYGAPGIRRLFLDEDEDTKKSL